MDAVSACAAELAVAPFDPGGWARGIELFAEATGSWGGQLIGRSSAGLAAFHMASGSAAEAEEDWLAGGGLDADANPMVAASPKMPLLRVFTDTDFLSPDERRRHRLWQLHERLNIPHVACSLIWRRGNEQIVLAAVRSNADGPYSPEDRLILNEILPRWRSAVVLNEEMAGEGGRMVASGLEVASLKAFVLDRFCQVTDITQTADHWIAQGKWLVLRRGLLTSSRDMETAAISKASYMAINRNAPSSLRFERDHGFLDIHVAPLPASHCRLGLSPAAILICKESMRLAKLTPAETAIANLLVKGHSLSEIAYMRSTSNETVRGQAKTIYVKAGVKSQLELIVLSNPEQPRLGNA